MPRPLDDAAGERMELPAYYADFERIDRLMRYAIGILPESVKVSRRKRNWAEPYDAITIRRPMFMEHENSPAR